MTDEKKQAILAELVELTRGSLVQELPEGAMTIEELVAGLKAELPMIGYDRSVKMIHAMVEQGKLQSMRVGSRKYYYKA